MRRTDSMYSAIGDGLMSRLYYVIQRTWKVGRGSGIVAAYESVCRIPFLETTWHFRPRVILSTLFVAQCRTREWAKRCQISSFFLGAEDSLYSMPMEEGARSTHIERRGLFSTKCPLCQMPDPPKLGATTSIILKHRDSQSQTLASRRRIELSGVPGWGIQDPLKISRHVARLGARNGCTSG